MPRAQAHGPSSALSPATAHAPGSPWQPSLRSTVLLKKACQNLTARATLQGQLEYNRKVQTGTAAADPDARGTTAQAAGLIRGSALLVLLRRFFFLLMDIS